MDRAYRNGQLVMDSKQDLVDEIERLRAALTKIADPNVPWGHMKLIAREALEQHAPGETK